jgi:hypothetical protein
MRRRLLIWAVATLLAGTTAALTSDADDESLAAVDLPRPRVEIRDPGLTTRGPATGATGSTVVTVAPSDPVLGAAPTTLVAGETGDATTAAVPQEPAPATGDPEPAPAPAPEPPVAGADRQLRLSGRIVDDRGEPADDMCVTATPSSVPPMRENVATGRTDADGRYVLEARNLVVNADPQRWWVSAYDCGTRVPGLLGPAEEIEASIGADATFNGTATTGVALRVHAVDDAGAAVPGFCVYPGVRAGADGIAFVRTYPPGEAVLGAIGCRVSNETGSLTGPDVDLGFAPRRAGAIEDRTVVVPPAPGDDRSSPVSLAVDGGTTHWSPHTLTATSAPDELAPACAPGPVIRSVWATLDGANGSVGIRASGVGTLALWQEVGSAVVPLGCIELGTGTDATIDAVGRVLVQLAATEADSFGRIFLSI